MKATRFSFYFLGMVGICLAAIVARAQSGQIPTSSTANAILAEQIVTSFAHSQIVNAVRLIGSATWHSGSREDTGNAVLTVSADGHTGLQLELGTLGQKTETQTSIGSNATCQWSGNDGVAHEIHSSACWRPLLWFLPAFSIQPQQMASDINLIDLGDGSIGSSQQVYRHIRVQFATSSSSITEEIATQSSTDLGLDPQSMLPAILSYSIAPDNGTPISIPVRILYLDYRSVDGVNIPFLIQRYVNGILQLEIHVTSATVN